MWPSRFRSEPVRISEAVLRPRRQTPLTLERSLASIWGLVLVLAPIHPPVAAGQAKTLPYLPPSQAAVLGTTFVDWNSLTPRATSFGFTRPVFDNPTRSLEKLDVHVATLRPGMSPNGLNHHLWEEILLVKEGSLEISVNGIAHRAGPGFLVFVASNDLHSVTAVGNTPATFYVINFYTDLTHTVPDKPAVEQAIPGTLPSSFIDCNSLPASSSKTGSHVNVLRSRTLTFLELESHISTLNVGQSTAADIVDPGDEVLVVKSGLVEVTVNGIASRMSEGSVLYWAPNDKRTLRNIGTTPTSYQIIRVMSAKSPKAAGE